MMNDQEISSDKLSSKVNALIIIDMQEKIIRPIFNKDSIIKNIKKLINAYQILEENILISEQNPLKLGVTIPELLPIAGFIKIEKMEFSLAKLEEFFREKLVIVHSQRLIDELFVFIYNGSRAEAMSGYHDDLVMSYAMGLWIRETALRLRVEGIELQKKAISSITSNQGVYLSTHNQNDSWIMETGKEKESLEWLIK